MWHVQGSLEALGRLLLLRLQVLYKYTDPQLNVTHRLLNSLLIFLSSGIAYHFLLFSIVFPHTLFL